MKTTKETIKIPEVVTAYKEETVYKIELTRAELEFLAVAACTLSRGEYQRNLEIYNEDADYPYFAGFSKDSDSADYDVFKALVELAGYKE